MITGLPRGRFARLDPLFTDCAQSYKLMSSAASNSLALVLLYQREIDELTLS